VLVLAKAPVPGQAKTRLGARVGNVAAAGLAAAGILDTLDVCEQVWTDRRDRHVALAGDLAGAADGEELRERLAGWTVHPQVGDGFAARLARAHADAARESGAPVVQIGMDTPHVTPGAFREVVDRLAEGADAVLGPAEDGGWWVLAVRDPAYAAGLAEVAMSTPSTYADTLAAVQAAGADVVVTTAMRDVDEIEDADAAATAAPRTRFARRWSSADRVVS